jgi:predicted dehydrogenase
VGLVGVGNVVRWLYLPRLRRPDSPFRLAAIYDVDSSAAEHVAATLGAEVCGSLKDLTRHASVEAVFVCTPVRFHCETVLASLDAGKHVICEKPLGRSQVEARRMWEVACKVGMVHMVNFSYRFRHDFSLIHQIIRSGMLGRIHHLWGSISQGQWFAENGQPSGRRADAAQWKYGSEGGVVLDLTPHVVDLCRWWLGEICQVRAWTQSLGERVPGAEAACGFALHFASGAVAQLLTSRLATGSREQMLLEVSGSQGALRLDQEILKLWTVEEPRWRSVLMPEQGPDFLAAFHSAVTGCADDRPTFEDGVKNNEIIDAIFHSARSSASVCLPFEQENL